MQPIFLQSFEQNNLKQLRPLTDLPIVQLLDDINVRAS
jgi:glycerophosphoryl diester phosphodiesterase